MKILITGAYGQLGRELKDVSSEFPQWQFLFTDVDSLDITDSERVQEFIGRELPQFIINCAAYTAVDKAETDYGPARELNAMAPSYLAKAAKQTGAGFITISTDYVFSGEGYYPYSETSKEGPSTVYGKTKLEGEQNCMLENPESIIIRTSWLYSSYGNNFVKKMLQLSENNDSLKVVFDQVGTPTYAADLAKTIVFIIKVFEQDRDNYIPGVYNFSNEGVASWYDFAKSIFEISGLSCKVVPVLSSEFPTPAKRPNYSVLNKSKIKGTFGIEIPYWKESLKICLNKLKR